MKDHSRSVVHFVLVFVFILSQVAVQPASAATINQPTTGVSLPVGQNLIGRLSQSRLAPEPAEKSVIVPAQGLKRSETAQEIANTLKLLGYTLPSYDVYKAENGLSIEPLAAYNLIVDSNVLSPSSYGPSAATFGAKFCNTNTAGDLTNVTAYIGNYDSDYNGAQVGGVNVNLGGTSVTPGLFPKRSWTGTAYDTVAFANSYGSSTTNPLVGTALTDFGVTNAPFALQLASGTTPPEVDATRNIGTLAPGDCRTEYWVITYPRKAYVDTDNNGTGDTWRDVTGGVKPDDDLWLPYWFWGTSTSGSTTATSYRWNAVTMRNEISAMANKIWPNGDNKVPDRYVQAIAQLVGWDTWTSSGTGTVYPGDTVISEGIWYDLGNVGAGFDNNGDFVPDRNIWVQPIGDASGYDPGCFRLVHTYGLIIVKLNDGTEQLIPFEDQMYFENIPDNNNGAVGLVYYQYAALDGVCTASLTPYQEVASGYDNEKFNADYGAGIPPLQSQESNMTLDKTGPNSVGRVAPNNTVIYSLTFTLPDINTTVGNNQIVVVGQPSLGAPLTYSDTVPVGLQYVACSAFVVPPGTTPPASCTNPTVTVDMSTNYAAGDIYATLWHSKDGGATWIMGDPGTYTSSSTSNQLVLQWRLQTGVASPASGAAYTGTVTFQAVVPSNFAPMQITNGACLKIGQGPGFTCDEHTTLIEGSNWLGGQTWKDDGIGTSTVFGNGIKETNEGVVPRVTVSLYHDTNADGVGDLLLSTQSTLSYPVVNGYLDIDRDGITGEVTQDDLPDVRIVDGYVDFDRDGITNGDTGDTGTIRGFSVINGRLDLNGVGGVTTDDDGGFLGYSVIDGYVDVDGDKTVSGDGDDDAIIDKPIIAGRVDISGNGTIGTEDDGTYWGYIIRDGFFDIDRDGSAISDADDDLIQGSYRFGALPDANYVVAVDTSDPDLPIGYAPTTRTTRTASLDPSGANLATVSATGLDFGFAPALKLDKYVANGSSFVIGDTIEYKIAVTNTLPGPGDASSGNCSYVLWSKEAYVDTTGTPQGGNGANAQWVDIAKVLNGPDSSSAYTYIKDNSDKLGLSGYNIGDMGGTITSVQFVAKASEKVNLAANDNLLVYVYYNNVNVLGNNPYLYNGAGGYTAPATAGYFTGGTGSEYTIIETLNPVTVKGTGGTWAWSDFAGDATTTTSLLDSKLEFQVVGDKGAGDGDLFLDAFGVRITTDQQCSGAATTLNPVPLTDTYNDTYFDFVSADPPISNSTAPTGTLNWNNVGPLYPGQTRTITVYMKAALNGATTNTDNTATSANARFTSGLPANSPVSDTATVTINTASNTRSLAGRIFDDNNNPANGWAGAFWASSGVGYDTSDAGIQYIPVELYGCVSASTNALITNENNNQTCLAAGGVWRVLRSTSTDSNGDYTFSNLAPGYYRVRVMSSLIAGSQTADVNATATGVCGTPGCDSWSNLESEVLQAATFVGNLDDANTNRVRINFGYDVPTGTYNIGDLVFYDWDGDGTKDTEDEPIPNITMRLLAADGTYLTSTNTSGIYGFSSRARAWYTVEVDTADPEFPSGLVQTKDPDSTMDNKSSFALTANRDDIDFGYKPYGSGTIGDTVFMDLNGNGTQDGTGETGIAGATVLLQVDWDGNGTYVTVKTATTNSSGNYLFTGLPAGTYRVTIDLASNASTIPDDPFGNNYLPSNGTNNGTIVYMTKTLATSTSSDLTADFGFAPPASIGDTVYWDSNGNGTQDTGEPGVNDVSVRLYTFVDELNGKYDVGETYTDSNSDGKWDRAETFTDLNNNGVRDGGEPFTDRDGDGVWDPAELFTDAVGYGGDGKYNPGEYFFSDTNGNGDWDSGEPRETDPYQVTAARTTTTATTNGQAGKYMFTGLDTDQTGVGYVVVVDTRASSNSPVYDRTLTGDPGTDGVICNGQVVCDSRDGQLLYPGSSFMGADFGYLPTGTIGDTLWIDTNNNGVRETTEVGIDNVTVRLCTTSTCSQPSEIVATQVTNSNGNYFFTNISAGTYYVVVDTADTDLTSLGVDQTFEMNNGNGTDNNSGPENITEVVVGTVSGVPAVTSINGIGCTNCGSDVDFGYRYVGNTTISGTVCLETSIDGVCGTGVDDIDGVGTGETAYRNVTVFLYRLIDANANGRYDAGETTTLVSSVATTSTGDYSFSNVLDGVYYVVAIGAPQSGLDLTSTQTTVNDNTGADDTSTTSYVETSAFDGSTLSAFQVVNTAGDTTVTDRDFAFKVDGSYDFGDLPASYSTLLSGTPDGARHEVLATPTLYLGTAGATQSSLVDADGSPTADASGDGADENGVFLIASATENADGWTDGRGVLQLDIVAPSTGGWLVGWIDFDGDGGFSDANEMIINQAVSSGQDQNIEFTTPTSTIPGSYVYARFRLFSSEPALPQLSYSGAASSGEVEDYRFPNNGGVITPVTLAYFHAQRQGSQVNFEWSTATETGNLGFNLFVQTKDESALQINDSIVLSNVINSLVRQDYQYSMDVGGTLFYLQEVSVLGETRMHGPFQLGKEYGGLPTTETIDLGAIQVEHNEQFVAQQASARKKLQIPDEALQAASLVPSSKLQLQNTVNLKVNKTGLYRVTYEMLKSAGLDFAGVPAKKITLINQGLEVPIFIETKGLSGKFGAGAYFEFYGEALDTLYTDTNIYVVQIKNSAAPRIDSNQAAPSNATDAPVSFQDTLVVHKQNAYSNFTVSSDPWYDTQMVAQARRTWNIPFQLDDLVESSLPQRLDMDILGSTKLPVDPDHHIVVRVNGVFVADERFDGMVERNIRAILPAGTLRKGLNVLELTLPVDNGAGLDVITLEKYSLTYSRSFQAKDGRFTFSATGKLFTVTNLPTTNVVVYRKDEKGLVQLGGLKVAKSGTTYSATFAGTNKPATYFVSAVESLYTPSMVITRVAADLNRPAEYLIIAHPDFISGLQPLIQARMAQGFTVSVVDVNDLYAQYSYHIFDPQAIRSYIAYAAENLGTQYVLLVGGDTYDYRNYLGRNSISFIPSLYATTGSTASFVPVDPLYADVNGDQIPDLAIGRFPVRTAAELKLMVSKTLTYAVKNYGRTAVFASDKFDGTESFKYISQSISASLPAGWTIQNIHMDDMSVATAQMQLISAMNRGPAFVNYTGHSTPNMWSFSRLLLNQNAETLTNTGRPFVVVQWGCFNTYYVDPLNKALAQSFLFAGDRGAVAVMGASTRTESSSEEALGVLLTPRLATPGMTVGQAMRDAKVELAEEHPELLDVIIGWTLMGDPALVIEP